MTSTHLLQELKFPARYERVIAALGPEVGRLLVSPGQATVDALEAIALAIEQDDEGLLCPIYAEPGTGKTTLAHSLENFLGSLFGATLKYDGPLSARELSSAVAMHRKTTMTTSDERVTPINIDSRETYPPGTTEMAELKQFVRTDVGAKSLIVWPTTVQQIAKDISTQYTQIVGGVSVELPLEISGPDRAAWPEIASDTLRLVNKVDSLELLVSPEDYRPEDYPSIGQYLRAMSQDFMTRRLELLRSTRKPLKLTILFGSESTDAGVLGQLTSGTRYGLLDGSALIGITRDSEIGQWWDARRGLLTQAIVQLDAHAFAMAPTTTIAVLRHYGDDEVRGDIGKMTFKSKGANAVAEALARSDIGRHLQGQTMAAYEARGNPGDASVTAFSLLVEKRLFAGNRDREVNKAIARAIDDFLSADEQDAGHEVKAEKNLENTTRIPDIQVVDDSLTHCIEFAWRQGDYLQAKYRAKCAAYILEKLKA